MKKIIAMAIAWSWAVLAGAQVLVVPNIQVATVADLADVQVPDESFVTVRSFATEGDAGDGIFRYDATATDTPDGGMVIAGPNGVGRFFRLLTGKGVSPHFYASSLTETDWDDEINAAAIHCDAKDTTLYFPAFTFNINGTVTLRDHDVYSDSHATINVTDRSAIVAGGNAAVKLGEGTDAAGATLIVERRIILPRIIQGDVADEWAAGALTSEGGLWIDGARRCYIECPLINNFGIGILCEPDSDYGVFGNRTHVYHLQNNPIGLQISPGDNGGACNEDYWYINRFSIDSGEGTDIAGTKAIYITQQVTNRNIPNGHYFFASNVEGPSFERIIDVVGGRANVFSHFRFESTNKRAVFDGLDFTNRATDNLILYPTNTTNLTVTENTNAQGTKVISADGADNILLGQPGAPLRMNNTASAANPILELFPPNAKIVDSSLTLDEHWTWQFTSQNLTGRADASTTGQLIRIEADTGDIFTYALDIDTNPVIWINNSTLPTIGFGDRTNPISRTIGMIGALDFGVTGDDFLIWDERLGVDTLDDSPIASLDLGGVAALNHVDGTDDIAVVDDGEFQGALFVGAGTVQHVDGGSGDGYFNDDLEVAQDLHVGGAVHEERGGSYNVQTISAQRVLSTIDARFQHLDGTTTTYDVLLPAEAISDGLVFEIWNQGATNDLVIKEDSDTTTIATLNPGERAKFVCNGTTWIHCGISSVAAN